MTTLALTRFALLLALPALGGCAIIPDTPRVGQEAANQGTPIALGQSAWLGDAIVTPLAIVEDSRCPVDAQCVQAGKLTVSTRITATHWRQTVPLTLGEPYQVMSRNFVLVSATPTKNAGQEIPPGAYRFAFTAGQ
ncbi:hypothetical protein A9995_12450 [Erythrobacter sp. QSSC1-22B]|uniref:hypothetical protein n=1 Tax=Erythrobacter sp. QSSC1-22B TaxID=1860125 RepID=UPI000805DDE7|nr:hypothetical protein [Erythrobacter sp. QSSC1-22B]OBX18290.1 hypothetical protein A9995_12450 [Erythrobacter sp. QSSC1-22B]